MEEKGRFRPSNIRRDADHRRIHPAIDDPAWMLDARRGPQT